MSMIELTFVRGSVEDDALGRLADELVTALLRAERAGYWWQHGRLPTLKRSRIEAVRFCCVPVPGDVFLRVQDRAVCPDNLGELSRQSKSSAPERTRLSAADEALS
ncbi:hypothetical protein [Mycobacterium paraseoulense]|uniref:hypothetical protein n=1 Tax=Mycobacterium paraseoulense TaxID=590652 RepID=UPI0011500265|nr:hypothetical protein [Mycobacterium paraseoulense]MCV7395624.1 hypothetical protein [Mycobacterium paraseoulense]